MQQHCITSAQPKNQLRNGGNIAGASASCISERKYMAQYTGIGRRVVAVGCNRNVSRSLFLIWGTRMALLSTPAGRYCSYVIAVPVSIEYRMSHISQLVGQPCTRCIMSPYRLYVRALSCCCLCFFFIGIVQAKYYHYSIACSPPPPCVRLPSVQGGPSGCGPRSAITS